MTLHVARKSKVVNRLMTLAGSVIVAGFAVKILLYLLGSPNDQLDRWLNVMINGGSVALFFTNALNFLAKGQKGLAAIAFAGAACALILTVAIFFPPA